MRRAHLSSLCFNTSRPLPCGAQSRNLSNVLGSDDMTAKLTGGATDAADDDEDDDAVPVAGSASEGEGSDEEDEDEEEEEEEAGGAEDSVSALENAWDCKQHFAPTPTPSPHPPPSQIGLDTARLILTKSGGNTAMLIDVLCALADVSMFQVTPPCSCSRACCQRCDVY
jgi:hypothetical protein